MKQLKYPQFPENVHVRTCQECGHTQVAKHPKDYTSDNWRDLKCKRCKSESMDYGQTNTIELSDED